MGVDVFSVKRTKQRVRVAVIDLPLCVGAPFLFF
jgi:hypothetical protein